MMKKNQAFTAKSRFNSKRTSPFSKTANRSPLKEKFSNTSEGLGKNFLDIGKQAITKKKDEDKSTKDNSKSFLLFSGFLEYSDIRPLDITCCFFLNEEIIKEEILRSLHKYKFVIQSNVRFLVIFSHRTASRLTRTLLEYLFRFSEVTIHTEYTKSILINLKGTFFFTEI